MTTATAPRTARRARLINAPRGVLTHFDWLNDGREDDVVRSTSCGRVVPSTWRVDAATAGEAAELVSCRACRTWARSYLLTEACPELTWAQRTSWSAITAAALAKLGEDELTWDAEQIARLEALVAGPDATPAMPAAAATLAIVASDLRPGDRLLDIVSRRLAGGVAAHAYDVAVAEGLVRVWTSLPDQDAGAPRELELSAGQVVLVRRRSSR